MSVPDPCDRSSRWREHVRVEPERCGDTDDLAKLIGVVGLDDIRVFAEVVADVNVNVTLLSSEDHDGDAAGFCMTFEFTQDVESRLVRKNKVKKNRRRRAEDARAELLQVSKRLSAIALDDNIPDHGSLNGRSHLAALRSIVVNEKKACLKPANS